APPDALRHNFIFNALTFFHPLHHQARPSSILCPVRSLLPSHGGVSSQAPLFSLNHHKPSPYIRQYLCHSSLFKLQPIFCHRTATLSIAIVLAASHHHVL
ncbi:hypothetical protein PIB30_105277, partial [Stylosanthes scabra]|nr:hypothetical protein [Stylosanthes scabra]